jgi:hypothetical protein
MPRPALGDRPMTPAERSARRRQLQAERAAVMEAALRDLLRVAERGTIGAKYVAQKCAAALATNSAT